MPRKIAVVTSSRADYAHLRWLLADLMQHRRVELQIIELGPHLSPLFGRTGQVLGKSKSRAQVTQVECLLDSDSDVGMAKTIGIATISLADAFGRVRPDIVMIIADRYEMLAPASAALALRIPIAHIEGGEITMGAIDDSVRNALTKMAHLHFACTRRAAQRIIGMGEEPWRVKFSGSLSLDFRRREKLLNQAQLAKAIGIAIHDDAIICVHHPVTLLKNTVEEASAVFSALQTFTNQIVFVYPNADAGSRELIRRTQEFASSHNNAHVLVNLEHRTFLSLLKNAGVLVGNSSSGIIESTSLEVPAVNVGIRQRGREHARNVIDVPADSKAIAGAIRRALTPAFRRSVRRLKSPYGDGNAAQVVSKVLTTVPLGAKLLFKHSELL